MKLKSISILLLLTVFCFLGCRQQTAFEREYAKIANVTPQPRSEITPSPPIPKKVYKEPEVGMSLDDFKKLCVHKEDRTSEDRVDTFESANGLSITYRLGYTTAKGKTYCFGTFRFFELELESISR